LLLNSLLLIALNHSIFILENTQALLEIIRQLRKLLLFLELSDFWNSLQHLLICCYFLWQNDSETMFSQNICNAPFALYSLRLNSEYTFCPSKWTKIVNTLGMLNQPIKTIFNINGKVWWIYSILIIIYQYNFKHKCSYKNIN